MMAYVQWPITIKMQPNAVSLNGVELSYMQLAELINEITHPDPTRWFRLERVGDCVHINVRISEDEPHGTQINTVGNGEANDGGARQAAAYPAPAHPKSS